MLRRRAIGNSGGELGKEELPYILIGANTGGTALQSFFAIEKSTKQIVSPTWQSTTESLRGITYDDLRIYLGLGLKIEVIDIETKTHIPNYFPGSPLNPWGLWNDDERIYGVGSFTNRFYVMNKNSKQLETGWPAFANSTYEVFGEGDLIYVAGGGISSASQGYHVIDKNNKEVVSGYPVLGNDAYGCSVDSQYIYLGGVFTGTNKNRFAVIDKVSKELQSGWPSFTSGHIYPVVNDDERIYVGGGINQSNAVRFAVINKSTKQLESGWPSFNNAVNRIAVDDEYIFIVGSFTDAGRNRFAVINKQTKQFETGWPDFNSSNNFMEIKI